ncbi:hypothetical protein GCM10018980_63810 [Streptomyces capoamus]|uniref:Uncharacterized protein n=1 Tax=Streptomyces capoamus TaxID=68183 RepID=A0A919F253_9ACTN|nr:hypothetical protein [Streptomyces capoamus]GGW14638.1 hypothetical protein GCM10010501_23300 [Streptomyces libani subsp. rufus]GHG69548.1 hypothetical protein GCM10018980_63810 [Streptomyces capoamus]
MELAPLMPNRLANSVLGVGPAVGGVVYAVQADGMLARVAACLAVTGFVVLAVRGYRLGVTCLPTALVVRGYLRTRVIARESITGITDFPAVRWTTRGGRRRWTPLTALMTSAGEVSGMRVQKERALGQLRRWARV